MAPARQLEWSVRTARQLARPFWSFLVGEKVIPLLVFITIATPPLALASVPFHCGQVAKWRNTWRGSIRRIAAPDRFRPLLSNPTRPNRITARPLSHTHLLLAHKEVSRAFHQRARQGPAKQLEPAKSLARVASHLRATTGERARERWPI